MPNPILKRFTVAGAGDFPLDQLRVDQCWPATPADAGNVGASSPGASATRTVVLETAAKYSPNRQRWSALGWRVID